jgi:virulence-associated protein VapD
MNLLKSYKKKKAEKYAAAYNQIKADIASYAISWIVSFLYHKKLIDKDDWTKYLEVEQDLQWLKKELEKINKT